jgi:hypothetical protein
MLAALTKQYVNEFNAPGASGITNSLLKKLENAQKSTDSGQTISANDQLNSFISEVTSIKGIKISNANAEVLIEWASTLILE